MALGVYCVVEKTIVMSVEIRNSWTRSLEKVAQFENVIVASCLIRIRYGTCSLQKVSRKFY